MSQNASRSGKSQPAVTDKMIAGDDLRLLKLYFGNCQCCGAKSEMQHEGRILSSGTKVTVCGICHGVFTANNQPFSYKPALKVVEDEGGGSPQNAVAR